MGNFSAYIGADGQYLETGVIGYESDAFIFKMDRAGSLVWGVALGAGPDYEHIAGAKIRGNELVMTGQIAGSWAVGVDLGTGDTTWMRSFASPGYAVGRGMALAGDHLVMTGTFEGSLSFGGTSITSLGLYDAFLWIHTLE